MGNLTTHSTGLAIGRSVIFDVNCSPVNSGVRLLFVLVPVLRLRKSNGDEDIMKQRFALSVAFLLVLIPVALLLHLLLHLTIYTDNSYAALRMAVFGSCIFLMALSKPKWISGRISFLLFAVLFVELIMYFRPVPIDTAGIGEAVDWFLPFWLYINLVNIILIPAAVILLIYSYVHGEKPYYIIFAASYLVLLAFLFPFERICRLGAYALM